MEQTGSKVITLYIKDLQNQDELRVKVDEQIQKGTLLADLETKRKHLYLEKSKLENQLSVYESKLNKVNEEQSEALSLKEKENQLLGVNRSLDFIKIAYEPKLLAAKKDIARAQADFKKNEEEREKTFIYSPAAGRVLSIQVQHTTATIRILSKEY